MADSYFVNKSAVHTRNCVFPAGRPFPVADGSTPPTGSVAFTGTVFWRPSARVPSAKLIYNAADYANSDEYA